MFADWYRKVGEYMRLGCHFRRKTSFVFAFDLCRVMTVCTFVLSDGVCSCWVTTCVHAEWRCKFMLSDSVCSCWVMVWCASCCGTVFMLMDCVHAERQSVFMLMDSLCSCWGTVCVHAKWLCSCWCDHVCWRVYCVVVTSLLAKTLGFLPAGWWV